ncbi:MAG: ASCH domain-containing protein [Lutispora sp.]|nr:ASCH domain-containing protein [Lutispora sp.]
MKSLKEPFDLIKIGQKNIEIRLFDDKRKELKIDDIIIFSKLPNCREKLIIRITGLKRYDSFSHLFENIPPKCFGWDGRSIDWMLNEIYMIYSMEQEKKYGIIAISFKLCS